MREDLTYDGHGSVRALTNPNGAVTDTYDHDAFSNLLHQTGTTANNYLFVGEQFDPDLGLYYTGYAQVLIEMFGGARGSREMAHAYAYGLERISENRQYLGS